MRKSIAVLLAAAISVNTIVASSSAMYNYNDGADIGITAAAAETMVASNYIISRGVPAYSEKSNNTSSANDDKYYTSWTGTAEDYIAYDLSSVPASQRKKVIAVWYNPSLPPKKAKPQENTSLGACFLIITM
ncbi:MAG: hypothetical protein IJN43_00025 [Ruminococcus sp.]|nr:hypothetical protein [Ruminococcus sp.]